MLAFLVLDETKPVCRAHAVNSTYFDSSIMWSHDLHHIAQSKLHNARFAQSLLPVFFVLQEIAEIKLPDLNCNDVEAAMKVVGGTAANMGIAIEA